MGWRIKRNFIRVGIALLFLSGVWGGIWRASRGPSPATPPPPLTDLLVRIGDVPDCGLRCEEMERNAARAMDTAELIGLPWDNVEGAGVFFLVHSDPHPQAVVESLYRYPSEEEARAHYERLIERLPLAPLNREPNDIINQSEWSSGGVQGRIIEVREPHGTAYWFLGLSGRLLIVMGVRNADFSLIGELEPQFFKDFEALLSIAVERMVESQKEPSGTPSPLPPLTDLLVRIGDVPNCGLGCEAVEQSAEQARKMAEFIGLPLGDSERTGVYFLIYTYPYAKAVIESLYRYPSEEQARASYEQLIESLPRTLINREPNRILSQWERSFYGVRGWIVEVQEPRGIEYWFFGLSGRLLMSMVVVNWDLHFDNNSGQQLFKTLLPIAVERAVGSPFAKPKE